MYTGLFHTDVYTDFYTDSTQISTLISTQISAQISILISTQINYSFWNFIVCHVKFIRFLNQNEHAQVSVSCKMYFLDKIRVSILTLFWTLIIHQHFRVWSTTRWLRLVDSTPFKHPNLFVGSFWRFFNFDRLFHLGKRGKT